MKARLADVASVVSFRPHAIAPRRASARSISRRCAQPRSSRASMSPAVLPLTPRRLAAILGHDAFATVRHRHGRLGADAATARRHAPRLECGPLRRRRWAHRRRSGTRRWAVLRRLSTASSGGHRRLRPRPARLRRRGALPPTALLDGSSRCRRNRPRRGPPRRDGRTLPVPGQTFESHDDCDRRHRATAFRAPHDRSDRLISWSPDLPRHAAPAPGDAAPDAPFSSYSRGDHDEIATSTQARPAVAV